MRKILVLRGGALGDFIVTLPALVALRRHWPAARIELAGNTVAAELARHRDIIDTAHSQHEPRWSAFFRPDPLPGDFAAWLREFDAIVNFWPDPDGELERWFPLRDGQRFVSASALPTRAPASAHYGEALRPLGVVAVEPWFVLRPLAESPPPIDAGAAAIAIHPGSGSVRKNWPADRWVDVIGRLSVPILLILGEAETPVWGTARLHEAGLGARLADGTLRIAANLPLEALVDELSRCLVFLGHDSGVSHLAAACGVPAVLLFGPTDPVMWAPPVAHVRVLRRGADVSQITPDEVLAAARLAIGPDAVTARATSR